MAVVVWQVVLFQSESNPRHTHTDRHVQVLFKRKVTLRGCPQKTFGGWMTLRSFYFASSTKVPFSVLRKHRKYPSFFQNFFAIILIVKERNLSMQNLPNLK